MCQNPPQEGTVSIIIEAAGIIVIDICRSYAKPSLNIAQICLADQSMFGVLVDVSGSMESAIALDSSKDASVERVHAIITTTLKVVKAEVNNHNRSDEIFVSVFGLKLNFGVCNLIALLRLIAGPEKLRGLEPHNALIQLAKDHGAAHAEQWIREHLNKEEARDLFRVLCFDEDLVPGMIRKIPPNSISSSVLSGIGNYLPYLGRSVEGFAVRRTEAYRYAQELVINKDEIIERKLRSIEHSSPESVLCVSKLLDDLNLGDNSSGASSSLHSRIKELLDPIRPYIFGLTPMHRAIHSAFDVFHLSRAKYKVFLILSDGVSTDGNPLDLVGALQDSNVIRVSCYLTDEHIPNQRCLMDKAPSDWPESDGRRTLFNMSSTVRNIDPPVSFLLDLDNGWTLPLSGESRLFVQANSLDVVDELCKVVVAQLTNPCDGLVDLIGKVPLGQYINQENASFKPEMQDGKTCFANAIGTVFHLAMKRIVGRDDSLDPERIVGRDDCLDPERIVGRDDCLDSEQIVGRDDCLDSERFTKIKKRLIDEYDKVKNKPSTREILAKFCPEYRFHFKKVDEIHARQALNHRRPLVAIFLLRKNQWAKFHEFYKKTPKEILQRADVGGEQPYCHTTITCRQTFSDV